MKHQGYLRILTLLSFSYQVVSSFTSPVYNDKVAASKKAGVQIELPDFDELFHRIQKVSPLAKQLIEDQALVFDADIESSSSRPPLGLEHIIDDDEHFKWKTVEKNSRRLVHHIEKIENFQNLGCPIVRFRATIEGPCVGNRFAHLIMDLESRQRWDPTTEQVDQTYPIYDLETANLAMRGNRNGLLFPYGECDLLGIGYAQTAKNIVASSREQLTLCGLNEFDNGGAMIWGIECPDSSNHLLPGKERHVRARSHVFSVALAPTSESSFDVEYVLQLDIGGRIPSFLTTPVLIETNKSLFREAKRYFEEKDGEVAQYIKAKELLQDICLESRAGILLTP